MNNSKKIILARHGESVGGSQKLVQHRYDVLSAKGIQQAKQLAKYLEKENIDHIISSPSFRALQTATIVTGMHDMTITTMEEIVEIDFGTLKGKPPTHKTIEQNMELGKGENPFQVFERVKRGWANLTSDKWQGTILVVSHRSILSAIEAIIENGTVQDFLNNRNKNDSVDFGYWKTIII